MSFRVQHERTKFFACQNPLNQGGGRKGLPKSFLNRFTQVRGMYILVWLGEFCVDGEENPRIYSSKQATH